MARVGLLLLRGRNSHRLPSTCYHSHHKTTSKRRCGNFLHAIVLLCKSESSSPLHFLHCWRSSTYKHIGDLLTKLNLYTDNSLTMGSCPYLLPNNDAHKLSITLPSSHSMYASNNAYLQISGSKHVISLQLSISNISESWLYALAHI